LQPIGSDSSPAAAGQINAMGVADEAVEDGAGTDQLADALMRFVAEIWLIKMAQWWP
jgi:hypothetical protein